MLGSMKKMTSLETAWAYTVTLLSTAISDQLDRIMGAFCPRSEAQTPEWSYAIHSAVAGGKRFRGLGALIGSTTVEHRTQSAASLLNETVHTEALDLAVALELYQASALIHDDIIDRADQRRGAPSTHAMLTREHQKQEWLDSAEHFGMSGALLAGDFLMSAGNVSVAQTVENIPSQVPTQYAQMTAEVAYGQYLDLRSANVPLGKVQDPVETALTVARLKSARYSVVHPVVMGALWAGAEPPLVRKLERIFEPAGLAFQLRDDALGVFGAQDQTGKPAGGDIREKKRTVLLALAFQKANRAQKAVLEAAYHPDATDPDIEAVTEVLRARGQAPHEKMIRELRNESQLVLRESDLPSDAKELCAELINRLTERRA